MKEMQINRDAFPYVQRGSTGADPLKMYQERMRAMFGPRTAPQVTPKKPAPAETP